MCGRFLSDDEQNNFTIHNKYSSDFAPILTYLVEGHFLYPKRRCRNGKSKNKEAWLLQIYQIAKQIKLHCHHGNASTPPVVLCRGHGYREVINRNCCTRDSNNTAEQVHTAPTRKV